jgi:hypothetical protein
MARIDVRAIKHLQPLLDKLRAVVGLSEIKPGIFYVNRTPMLHFHQTDDGVFADLKRVVPKSGGFDRFEVNTHRGKRALLAAASTRCDTLTARKPGAKESS